MSYKIVETILEAAREVHPLPMLRIVETGTLDTVDIALWCSKTPNSSFVSVDLDASLQESRHRELEELDAASTYTYRTQDHQKFLSELTWIDVAFLYPENLEEGLREFQLALSAGARLVIMRDYQTKAYTAAKQAKRFGWEAHFTEEYTILMRANN